jgi:hypothetical protein
VIECVAKNAEILRDLWQHVDFFYGYAAKNGDVVQEIMG